MGVLFISHSVRDNEQAIRVRDWLESEGWSRSQIFLDLHDFRSGDRWRARLDEAGGKCEAVIVCLSDDWIASPECVREFTHAESRGKPIFPVVVRPVTSKIPSFVSAIQYADISSPDGQVEAFEKLKAGLLGARIAPNSFPWPPADEPTRSVYRGLQALDVQDAPIFFGRDLDIARGLDELRRLRDGAPERLLVILGASGAGKSSFLRAGLLARLNRDHERFCVLPVVRPGQGAVTGPLGLNACLSAALGRHATIASSEELVAGFSAVRALAASRLQQVAELGGAMQTSKPPTLVVPIDQAEEIFGADQTEYESFSAWLAAATEQDGNVLIIATVRTDSYEKLQAGFLPHRQTLFTLPPVSLASFKEIIEGPPRLAKPAIEIASDLTERLLSDLGASDALPLLGFTLERLQRLFGQDGKLTLDDYLAGLGGLEGAIQSAVSAVVGTPPTQERLGAARRLFIPALVRVDRESVKRRVSDRASLPTDTLDLADRFIEQRLLVSDGNKIEVAHEAILRQWPALNAWISEERSELAALEALQVSASDWSLNSAGNNGQGWLAHHGDRLKHAEAIVARQDFAQLVDSSTRAYLRACRLAARNAVPLAIALALFAGCLWFAFIWTTDQALLSAAQRVVAVGLMPVAIVVTIQVIFGFYKWSATFSLLSFCIVVLNISAPHIASRELEYSSYLAHAASLTPMLEAAPNGSFLTVPQAVDPASSASDIPQDNMASINRMFALLGCARQRRDISFGWEWWSIPGGCNGDLIEQPELLMAAIEEAPSDESVRARMRLMSERMAGPYLYGPNFRREGILDVFIGWLATAIVMLPIVQLVLYSIGAAVGRRRLTGGAYRWRLWIVLATTVLIGGGLISLALALLLAEQNDELLSSGAVAAPPPSENWIAMSWVAVALFLTAFSLIGLSRVPVPQGHSTRTLR